MDELRKAKYKDEILNYLYDEREYAIPVVDIARVVTKKALVAKQVMDLCHEIISYDPELLNETLVGSRVAFRANENTLYFLDRSGFQIMHEQGLSKENVLDRKRREREEKQDDFQTLQAENIALNSKLTKQKIKTHFIPISISLVSLIFAGLAFFIPSKETTVTNEQLEKLQIRIDDIEGGLKVENKELKERLYTAEMMIRVLED